MRLPSRLTDENTPSERLGTDREEKVRLWI